MKISDQALLALMRMNSSKNPQTYFSQKVFCERVSSTVDLKTCEECLEKCIRFEKLMKYYEKYEMIK